MNQNSIIQSNPNQANGSAAALRTHNIIINLSMPWKFGGRGNSRTREITSKFPGG
jgi:hypothetical protein